MCNCIKLNTKDGNIFRTSDLSKLSRWKHFKTNKESTADLNTFGLSSSENWDRTPEKTLDQV